MIQIEPILSPESFIGLEDITHLAAGGESPWLKAQIDVFEKFARLKSAGYFGRREIDLCIEQCREKMGQLWGVNPERISWMPSASEGMSALA